MFRCDWCENYKDKSECSECPDDPCASICAECANEHDDQPRHEKAMPKISPPGFDAWYAQEMKDREEEEEEEEEED